MTMNEVVDRLARKPAASGLFTDFDGTLAPIVADPEQAVPLPGVPEALGELAGTLARVVVVSGRPASFLAERLAVALRGERPASLFGLHGLEQWVGEQAVPVRAVAPFAGAVAKAVKTATAAPVAGLTVEDKGLALTLHWRRSADPAATGRAARSLAAEIAGATGLRTREGKESVELLVPLPVDKGSVVTEEAVGLEAVCFMGDDVSDLPAFSALDALEEKGCSSLRVAVGGTEAPLEILERADLLLGGPGEVADLLARLLHAVSSDGERG
jgi:trehalose 6-phosphate phosphatase